MSEVHVVMPAYNEEHGIVRTLEALAHEAQLVSDDHMSLVIVPNGCSDKTADISRNWLEAVSLPDSLKHTDVAEIERGHKLTAINHGLQLDPREASITIVVDADITFEKGALGALIAILKRKEPLASSPYHFADAAHMPTGILGTIVKMADERRRLCSAKHKLHGALMGWNRHLSINGNQVRFPATTAASDDTWLTFAAIKQHGTEAVSSLLSEPVVYFIPPQNEADYIRQQTRYGVADKLVALCFPELQPIINDLAETRKTDEELYEDWRSACIASGLDFDASHGHYKALLEVIFAGQEDELTRLSQSGGAWEQVPSARISKTR